uniref:hypothetical protein n=1 Tax=Paraprevotella clara TaxID=454154 RepID=UPI00266D6427
AHDNPPTKIVNINNLLIITHQLNKIILRLKHQKAAPPCPKAKKNSHNQSSHAWNTQDTSQCRYTNQIPDLHIYKYKDSLERVCVFINKIHSYKQICIFYEKRMPFLFHTYFPHSGKLSLVRNNGNTPWCQT